MTSLNVKTNYGLVKGYERNGMVEFLGIPFAKPPIGELRFKRARECDQWKDPLNAKAYGSESVQLEDGQLKGSEDCLTLNIQRPFEGKNLPVLVWIHGGGYNTGSASCPLTDGKNFVEKGILYVSIQYRLNVLGFYDFTTYKGCEGFESNCGLSDQIMALKWIHENIAYFGGNPGDVTIMGESAGAASCINLMAAPAVRGYFQKAIIESGLPNCVMTHETARENIDLFIEGMGWTEEDLPKLRTIDPFELQKGNTYVAEKHQYKNPGMYLPGPIQDDLLPVRPLDAIKAGSAKDVKIIIGTNLNEGTMFVHPEKTGFPNSWEMVEEMFANNGCEDGLKEIKSYYSKANEDAFIDFATDYAFQMPAIKLADYQSKFNDVWMYRYELVTKSGAETGMRASHAFEMPAVFKNRDFGFSSFVLDGEDEDTVEQIFSAIHTPWSSFVLNNAPGNDWPVFKGAASEIKVFNRTSETKLVDRSELMRVWGDLRFYEK